MPRDTGPGFRIPTRIHHGAGTLGDAGSIARGLGFHRVLLVLDPGLAGTAWPDRLRAACDGAGLPVAEFDRIPANPRLGTVEAAAEVARLHRADGIVALGGGSTLDTAKAAALQATNPGPLRQWVGRTLFPRDPLGVLAIPTTAGTGSEVTWVSVVTDPDARVKLSIKGEALFPRAAVTDPDLLSTLPSPLAAATGMDALTHALEALTGTRANPFSDACAREAARALFTWLPVLVESGGQDPAARAATMQASTLAGIAFGNADVGAVHCLSESLGGMFDVPHGLANAMLLEPVLRSHRPHIDDAVASLGGGDPEPWFQQLRTLPKRLGIPPFPDLGLDPASFPQVARRAVENGSNGSNPRPMGESDYLDLLNALGSRPSG